MMGEHVDCGVVHKTLTKLYFQFLSDRLGYDRGDSFPSDFELNLVQNRKENCHHDHIPLNLEGNGNIVFSVQSNITKSRSLILT